jgi:hypothetical protein
VPSSKDNIRELAALVRTAADATGRAAELMLRCNAADDVEDEEMRKMRLMAEDLLNGNELVAKLAADRFRLEQAVIESQSLKLVCDATTCLCPIKREVAAIRAENNRLALKLKRRGQQRRSTDRR